MTSKEALEKIRLGGMKMTKMNKYHVKFTHQYARPQGSTVDTSSAIQYITETVDTEWELDAWINVFTYIYTNYEVIGSVEVTHVARAKIIESDTFSLRIYPKDEIK